MKSKDVSYIQRVKESEQQAAEDSPAVLGLRGGLSAPHEVLGHEQRQVIALAHGYVRCLHTEVIAVQGVYDV